MARQSMQDQSMGTDWKPENNPDGSMKMEGSPNDYIEGFLKNKKSDVGQHKSMVYEIVIAEPDATQFGEYTGFGEDGQVVNLWGCHVIDQHFAKIRLGQWVRVEYKGKKLKKAAEKKHPSQIMAGDYVKLMDVIIDTEIPDMKLEGVAPVFQSNAAPAQKPTPANSAQKAPVAVPASLGNKPKATTSPSPAVVTAPAPVDEDVAFSLQPDTVAEYTPSEADEYPDDMSFEEDEDLNMNS